MAKRIRAATRGTKNHAPTRAIESRRLKFTPALIADVRRRYEHTSEGLAAMAADLGCSIETVRNIATREGWLRYAPPPRDLSPAARLKARAEKLAEQGGDPGEGESIAEATPTRSPSPTALAGDLPLAGGGKEAPLALADTAEQLHCELLMLLAELRATRARMKRERYGKHDLRQTSQVIANLTATLRTLQPMLCPVAPAGAEDDHDDMPADIDEFRDALARRIAAFMESRPDDGDAADAAAAAVDET
jgi:hypothetical protein